MSTAERTCTTGTEACVPEEYVFTGDVAYELATNPIHITALFYRRLLDNDRCRVVRGRRLIPRAYIPEIRQKLIEHGYMKADQTPRPQG